jgi:hypothetical protein
MTFWKQKRNTFLFPLKLESGNGSVSISRKKGFSCTECMETETCLETRFRFQLLYSLSVVNSANDDPAKTPRVNLPVAEL